MNRWNRTEWERSDGPRTGQDQDGGPEGLRGRLETPFNMIELYRHLTGRVRVFVSRARDGRGWGPHKRR